MIKFSLLDLPLIVAGQPAAVAAAALQPSTTNLRMWLKADSITGKTTNDSMSFWEDSSGNGHHATQSNGPWQPRYHSGFSTMNGKPCIQSPDACRYMSVPKSLYANYTASQGAELYMVYTMYNHDSYLYIHNFGGNPANDNNFFHYNGHDKVGTYFGVSSLRNFTYPFLYSTRSIIHTEAAKTNFYQCMVNSSSLSLVTSALTALFYDANWDTGKHDVIIGNGYRGTAGEPGGAQCWSGSIAEVLFYNTVQTEADRITTFAYLADKYNITIGTPPQG